jgi:hypothetical protein
MIAAIILLDRNMTFWALVCTYGRRPFCINLIHSLLAALSLVPWDLTFKTDVSVAVPAGNLFLIFVLAFDDAFTSLIGAELLVTGLGHLIVQEQPLELSIGIRIQQLLQVFLLDLSLALNVGTFNFLNLSRHIHHIIVIVLQASLAIVVPAPLEDGNGGNLAFIVANGALEDLFVFCEEIFVRFHNPILEVEIFTTHLSQMRYFEVMEGVGPLRAV